MIVSEEHPSNALVRVNTLSISRGPTSTRLDALKHISVKSVAWVIPSISKYSRVSRSAHIPTTSVIVLALLNSMVLKVSVWNSILVISSSDLIFIALVIIGISEIVPSLYGRNNPSPQSTSKSPPLTVKDDSIPLVSQWAKNTLLPAL